MAEQDYYGDSEAPTSDAPAEDTTSEEKDEGKKTALIDSSICPNMKPGEEMVVTIEKVLDKEYLVSYAPEPGKDEETDEYAPESEGGTSGSMAAMYD